MNGTRITTSIEIVFDDEPRPALLEDHAGRLLDSIVVSPSPKRIGVADVFLLSEAGSGFLTADWQAFVDALRAAGAEIR
jgi:hypothetical protein